MELQINRAEYEQWGSQQCDLSATALQLTHSETTRLEKPVHKLFSRISRRLDYKVLYTVVPCGSIGNLGFAALVVTATR